MLCTSLSLQPDLQRTCPIVDNPTVQVKDVRGGQDEKGDCYLISDHIFDVYLSILFNLRSVFGFPSENKIDIQSEK